MRELVTIETIAEVRAIDGADAIEAVRSLAEEPPLLARYRATYPDEDQRPASVATSTWEDFKTDANAYDLVLAAIDDDDPSVAESSSRW